MKNRSGEKIKRASIDELLGVVNEESAIDRKSTRLNSSHQPQSRMPSSA